MKTNDIVKVLEPFTSAFPGSYTVTVVSSEENYIDEYESAFDSMYLEVI